MASLDDSDGVVELSRKVSGDDLSGLTEAEREAKRDSDSREEITALLADPRKLKGVVIFSALASGDGAEMRTQIVGTPDLLRKLMAVGCKNVKDALCESDPSFAAKVKKIDAAMTLAKAIQGMPMGPADKPDIN